MSLLKGPQANLAGWSAQPFTAAGQTYDVYAKGQGPGVVLMPEMPGIHPGVLALGNHLVDNGFTVACPSLFGTAGKPIGPSSAPVLVRGCITKEFAAFATHKNRPIADYIRALARDLNGRTPGPGVGVIGMCFTGGFALAAAADEAVLAPVLSQPSLPLPLTPAQRRDPGLSDAEMQIVQRRAADDGLCAIGLRFTRDPLVPGERFAALSERLGDAFEVIELDSGRGNSDGFGLMAHSVLTEEVREVDGHPAFEARKRVVQFLTERLVAR